MNVKELAELLSGRNDEQIVTKEEAAKAKENNLVVLYGYGDDSAILNGAVDDELDCYDGGYICFNKSGLVTNDCTCGDDCPNFNMEKYDTVEAVWDEDGWAWQYRTDIPHETFEIIDEDGEQWCKGIIFNLEDVKSV